MNVKLLTLLALGLSIPKAVFAQDSGYGNARKGAEKDVTDLYKKDLKTYKTKGSEYQYNTYTSGRTNVHKFDNKARMFRDWSISVGGGVSLMQRGDLTSFYDSKITPGYNVYVSLDKQISHTFGLSLQYQYGKSTQRGKLLNEPVIYPTAYGPIFYNGSQSVVRGVAEANTEYRQISLLGDLNFTSLFRRVDNRSPYRWALHGYLGLGLQGYKTDLEDNISTFVHDQSQDIGSFFYQGGLGLRFNVNKLIDLEARAMYVISGDDEFDGGGDRPETYPGYNLIKKNDSDNMLNATLGLVFKLGKKGATHLTWYDPMQEIYYRTERIEAPRVAVCEKGDNDNDGVCDDWDRQLNTPAEARVDGAGVALDMDLDGVIDLNDKCVTVAGPISNQGCPTNVVMNVANQNGEEEFLSLTEIDRTFEGVVFDLNEYNIKNTTAVTKLNEAAKVINSLNTSSKFLVVGATDTRGSDEYNLNLSQKRAGSVVNYLTKRGVPQNRLVAEGRGKNDLKYPECNPASNCPEWKNEANRRVYFEQVKK